MCWLGLNPQLASNVLLGTLVGKDGILLLVFVFGVEHETLVRIVFVIHALFDHELPEGLNKQGLN